MQVSKEMRYAMIRRAANKINQRRRMRRAAYNLLKETEKVMAKEKQ